MYPLPLEKKKQAKRNGDLDGGRYGYRRQEKRKDAARDLIPRTASVGTTEGMGVDRRRVLQR